MKNLITIGILTALYATLFSMCGLVQTDDNTGDMQIHKTAGAYTADTKISEVIEDPVFEDYGRLIFPVEDYYFSGNTLGELRLTWYNNINVEQTVEVLNYMKNQAEAGETIFYDIYTEDEKAEDPEKENTGLFSLGENRGENLRFVMRAEGLLTSAPYTIAFHTPSSFPKRAIMLSR